MLCYCLLSFLVCMLCLKNPVLLFFPFIFQRLWGVEVWTSSCLPAPLFYPKLPLSTLHASVECLRVDLGQFIDDRQIILYEGFWVGILKDKT